MTGLTCLLSEDLGRFGWEARARALGHPVSRPAIPQRVVAAAPAVTLPGRRALLVAAVRLILSGFAS